jgi:transcriptional regulator with XRE-family HTH domain
MGSAEPGSFGELLRRYRLGARLTQEELAERAGLSARGVQDLERGIRRTPHPDTVRRLWAALGLSDARRPVEQAEIRALRAGMDAAVAGERAQITPAATRRVQVDAWTMESGDVQPLANNLPAPISSFVGREHDMAGVIRALDAARLVTLVGTGGCGKTRLAVEVGTRTLSEYADGVWFVELAPLTDPELVPAAILEALRRREVAGQTHLAVLEDYLRSKQGLLVLDNCEHLIQGSAVFDRAMTSQHQHSHPAIVAAYDFSVCRTIVDVGGGHGALLAAILGANQEARGILFDRPSVVDGARAAFEKSGLAARCQLSGGDFFQGVPRGGDGYVLMTILHDWGDDEAGVILGHIRRAIDEAGRLLIIEQVIPPGPLPHPGKLRDMSMLLLGGKERTEAEFRSLLASAGFRGRARGSGWIGGRHEHHRSPTGVEFIAHSNLGSRITREPPRFSHPHRQQRRGAAPRGWRASADGRCSS